LVLSLDRLNSLILGAVVSSKNLFEARGARGAVLAFLAAALLLFPKAARADEALAQADYARGQQFQAQRLWTEAVSAYMDTLRQDPDFFYAYKSMGTTYYEAGDTKSALACYDRYLAMNPNDEPTRTFTEKLRLTLQVDSSPEAAARAVDEAAGQDLEFRPGWSVGAGLGGVVAQASDIDKLLPQGSADSYGASFAVDADLDADYGFANGLLGGVDLILGPDRNHALSSGDTADEAGAITVSSMGLAVEGGFRPRLGRNSWLDLRMGLGAMSSSLGSDEGGSGSGSGWLLWPQISYNMAFTPHWVGVFGAGYLASSVDPYSGGKRIAVPGGGDLVLDTGGFSLKLGVSYCFRSPVQ
jgi:hypothetical protein